MNSYLSCTLCPRQCAANRQEGKTGFCAQDAQLTIAWAGLHFGEEPPITVWGGSGTIFITGCNLRCAYCQNYQISQQGMGRLVSTEEFSDICLRLQKMGAENINIVTGSHAIPAIVEGLLLAKKDGLKIPICWNTSSYETIEALEQLSPVVDIWLPDLKTLNPLMSRELFLAENYPAAVKKSLRWMIQHTTTQLQEIKNGTSGQAKTKMNTGIIIRHLALPGRMDDTRLVLEWFKKNANGRAWLSIMSQYTPVQFSENEAQKRRAALASFQNRYLSQTEFDSIQDMLEQFDIENGFYQELEQGSDWLPDFNKTQPFSSELAKPLWHWKKGFVE